MVAHIIKQGVYLGGGNEVCSISVNGGAIRGEGGPLRPQLVVPTKFDMSQQPKDASVALTSFTASLGTMPHTSPGQTICQPVTRQLTSRFPATSQTYSYEHNEDVRFFLTAADVEDIEARRHAANSDIFTLYLSLEVVVVGLKTHNSQKDDQFPWNPMFGTFAEVFPFWTTPPQPIPINIEQSTWVNNVLPGLGYDRLRLVELNFPPPLPDHENAVSQFDKATRALNERRYDDCVGECRGLVHMWEKQLEATSNNPVADVVARNRGWTENDERRDLIYTLWQGISKIVSASHHRAKEPTQSFDRRDARLILMLTAALSEYFE
jgi:hypothetical protein